MRNGQTGNLMKMARMITMIDPEEQKVLDEEFYEECRRDGLSKDEIDRIMTSYAKLRNRCDYLEENHPFLYMLYITYLRVDVMLTDAFITIMKKIVQCIKGL